MLNSQLQLQHDRAPRRRSPAETEERLRRKEDDRGGAKMSEGEQEAVESDEAVLRAVLGS